MALFVQIMSDEKMIRKLCGNLCDLYIESLQSDPKYEGVEKVGIFPEAKAWLTEHEKFAAEKDYKSLFQLIMKIKNYVINSNNLYESQKRILSIMHLFNIFNKEIKDMSVFVDDIEEFLKYIEATLPSASDTVFKILTSSFNVVPNVLKSVIFNYLIKFCRQHGTLAMIATQLEGIDLIAARYHFAPGDKQLIFENAIEALKERQEDPMLAKVLHKVLMKYVQEFKGSSKDIVLLFLLSLRLYSVAQYNTIVSLEAYKELEKIDPKVYELMGIVIYQGLKEYEAWVKNNEETLKKYALSKEGIKKKLCMLLLCEMEGEKLHGKIDYKTISSKLLIKEEEIEIFVQEAVDNNIIEAKIDQLEETVTICSRAKRIILEEDWKAIHKSLSQAKEIVGDIIGNLDSPGTEKK